MTLLKWGYGALSIIATIFLIVSFFIPDTTPITQITLLLQAVGFGWVCGFAMGTDV